ncbi:ArdC-like ssDNA-binding domain-containing protein [Bacteroides heparinolyticus]|uniref:ArdC-like ssDNA-binding domain-containing protein n=1 Tax=Prevotella heparinolytica TaxID=28113 RepID=UPI0035A17E9A
MERLSKAEYARVKSEQVKELLSAMRKGVREVFASEEYGARLRAISRFVGDANKYSPQNTLLILMQKPEASYVMSYKKWQEHGRQVQRGEKGLHILAPVFERKADKEKDIDESKSEQEHEERPQRIVCYVPVAVFDVSQTGGDQLPLELKKLTGDVENYEMFKQSLSEAAGLSIIYDDKMLISNGEYREYLDTGEKEIRIKSGMSEKQTIKTLLHEIAHSRLHSRQNDTSELSRNTKEIEAESVAYIVSNYYGIDTSEYSFEYVASWSEDRLDTELEQSFNRICNTSRALVSEIDRCMDIALEAEREADFEFEM